MLAITGSTWMSVRPYSTESISWTTRSVVCSSDCRTSGRAVPRSPPLHSCRLLKATQWLQAEGRLWATLLKARISCKIEWVLGQGMAIR